MLFAAGYFAGGQFLVAGRDGGDVTYREGPLEFGLRLRRAHDAAGLPGPGRAGPRPVVLLADHEPVPPEAAVLVAAGLGGDVITVSRPATLFLDDHPAAGIPETRVALLPGGAAGDGPPQWAGGPRRRLGPAGRAARPRTPGAAPGRARGPARRPRDPSQGRDAREAGTGLAPGALRRGRQAAAGSAVAVRGPAGIDFTSPRSAGQPGSELGALHAGGASGLLEITADYRPPAPAGPVTGPPAVPVLAGRPVALPVDATDHPLYVLADFYGGFFLLAVPPAPGQAAAVRAEGPREFGRRIRAELTPAGPGQAPAPGAR